MLTKLKLTIGAAVLSVSQAGIASPPHTRVVTEQIAVYYGDLNLEVESGAEVLLRRIQSAAKQVCGAATALPLALRKAGTIHECRSKAVWDAVVAVNKPAVTAGYRAIGEADVSVANR